MRSAWRPGPAAKGKTGRMERFVVPRSQVNFSLMRTKLLKPASARRIVGIQREVRDSYSAQLRKVRRGL